MNDHVHTAPLVMACPHVLKDPRRSGVVWFKSEDKYGKYLQAICRSCRQKIAKSKGRKRKYPKPDMICAECLLGEGWEDYLIDVQPRKGVNP